MTSVLNVDTIADKAGTGPVALTKQEAVKAYGMVDGTGTVNLITSFNASGVTDNGTGDYTLNLTSSMGNTTYMFIIDSYNVSTSASARGGTQYTGGQAAGSFRFLVGYPSNTSGAGTKFDEDANPIALLGDLA